MAKNLDVRIVILQRGWVVVGRFEQKGMKCYIRGGHVVRVWGTTQGLGEIAMGGPTVNTKLDPIPEAEFHELTVIATLACNAAKWEKHLTE